MESIRLYSVARALGWAAILWGIVGSSSAEAYPPWGLGTGFELPHGALVSVDLKPWAHFSFGGSVGGLPQITFPSGSQSISLGILAPSAHLRWHPFGGAFFLGVLAGYQSYAGSITQTLAVTPGPILIPTTISGSVSSGYVTPHLGWTWGLGSPGFQLGLEGGWQLPFAPASNINVTINDPTLQSYLNVIQTLPAYQQAVTDVQSVGNRVILGTRTYGYPYFVFKLGWVF